MTDAPPEIYIIVILFEGCLSDVEAYTDETTATKRVREIEEGMRITTDDEREYNQGEGTEVIIRRETLNYYPESKGESKKQ